MRLEHVAFLVHDPAEVAAWYEAHLGMKVVRRAGAPMFAHFLADDSGLSLLEFYQHPTIAVPAYADVDPWIHHIAFAVTEIEATLARLVAAGGTAIGDPLSNPAGDVAVFVRDPWGVALQLVKRQEAML